MTAFDFENLLPPQLRLRRSFADQKKQLKSNRPKCHVSFANAMNPYVTYNQKASANPGPSKALLYVSRRVVWGAVIIAMIVSLPAIISGFASPILIPLLLVVFCTVVAMALVFRIRATRKNWRTKTSRSSDSGFVVDGYERAIDGIEAEVRPEIEMEYAEEWNASGLIRRWFLLRRIERKIAERVAEQSKHISPNSLF